MGAQRRQGERSALQLSANKETNLNSRFIIKDTSHTISAMLALQTRTNAEANSYAPMGSNHARNKSKRCGSNRDRHRKLEASNGGNNGIIERSDNCSGENTKSR